MSGYSTKKLRKRIMFYLLFSYKSPFSSRTPARKAVCLKKLTNTNERIAESLIRMFRDGPLVSFKGSPTVSPITAAACSLDPFFLTSPLTKSLPDSMYFFALSQAPPVFDEDMAIWTPETRAPGKIPAIAFGPKRKPVTNGVKMT